MVNQQKERSTRKGRIVRDALAYTFRSPIKNIKLKAIISIENQLHVTVGPVLAALVSTGL